MRKETKDQANPVSESRHSGLSSHYDEDASALYSISTSFLSYPRIEIRTSSIIAEVHSPTSLPLLTPNMEPSYEPKEPRAPVRTHTIARKPVATANTHFEPLTSSPSAYKTSFISRLRTRWSILSRRVQILILLSLVALLALILGLSIGLSTRTKTQNLPLPGGNGGPFTGDLTYYDPGLGSCGITSSSTQNIVAVAHSLYDAAQKGSDPNQNPLCGRKIRAKRVKEGSGERSVDLTVVDRCTGCKPTDIDVSLSVFEKLATQDLGRVTVQWNWLD